MKPVKPISSLRHIQNGHATEPRNSECIDGYIDAGLLHAYFIVCTEAKDIYFV